MQLLPRARAGRHRGRTREAVAPKGLGGRPPAIGLISARGNAGALHVPGMGGGMTLVPVVGMAPADGEGNASAATPGWAP